MASSDTNIEFRQEIESKIHKLTELIVENDKDTESEDYLIHPDFIRAMEALSHVQEHGYIADETMRELNSLYKKHKDEYDKNQTAAA